MEIVKGCSTIVDFYYYSLLEHLGMVKNIHPLAISIPNKTMRRKFSVFNNYANFIIKNWKTKLHK